MPVATPAAPAAPRAAAPAAVTQAADSAVDEIMEGLDFAPAAAGSEEAAVEGDAEGEAAAEGEEPQAADAVEADEADEVAAEAEAAAEGDGEAEEEQEAGAEGQGGEKGAQETPPVEAAPVQDPKAAARAQADAVAYTKWEQDFGTIEAKLADKNFDPIDDGPAAVSALAAGFKFVKQAIGELHAGQEQLRQERATERFWENWGRQNPAVGVDKGRKAFEEEFGAALKKHGDPRVATAVAEERWANRMKIAAGVAKGKAPAARIARPAAAVAAAAGAKGAAPIVKKPPATPAGKPPTPITQGGGRVLPPASVKAPPTRPKTFAEKRDTGAYGSFVGLVD